MAADNGESDVVKGNIKTFPIEQTLENIKNTTATGTLAVQKENSLIRLTFATGQVVGAETDPKSDEERIGMTIVANGWVTRDDWKKIRYEHENSLQPIWAILKNFLPAKKISFLIDRQIRDNFTTLLMWKEGTYEYKPTKKIVFDKELVVPLNIDDLMLAAVKVIDDMDRFKYAKIAPPQESVVKQNILSDADVADLMATQEKGKSLIEVEFELLASRNVELTENEKLLLGIIRAEAKVKNVFNATTLGYYDCLEAICGLIQRKLIVQKAGMESEESARQAKEKTAAMKKVVFAAAGILILLGLAVQALLVPANIRTSVAGLADYKIHKTALILRDAFIGVQIYHAQTGNAPKSMDDAVNSGALGKRASLDPWGRKIEIKPGSQPDYIRIISQGPSPGISNDDIVYTQGKQD